MATADYQYRGRVIRETAGGAPLVPGEVVTLSDPLADEDKALVESRELVYLEGTDGDNDDEEGDV